MTALIFSLTLVFLFGSIAYRNYVAKQPRSIHITRYSHEPAWRWDADEDLLR